MVPDVLLHGGFRVEVLHVGEFAIGEFGDIQEGRPDKMLNAGFLLACQHLDPALEGGMRRHTLATSAIVFP